MPAEKPAMAGTKRKHASDVPEPTGGVAPAGEDLATLEDAMTAYFLEANTNDELGASLNSVLTSHKAQSALDPDALFPQDLAEGAATAGPVAGSPDPSAGSALGAAVDVPLGLPNVIGDGDALTSMDILNVLDAFEPSSTATPQQAQCAATGHKIGHATAASGIDSSANSAMTAPIAPGGATRKPPPKKPAAAASLRAASAPKARARSAAPASSAAPRGADEGGDDGSIDDEGGDGSEAGDDAGGDVDERKLKRMRRNRESAMRSRHRRKAYIEELEGKVAALTSEVARLTGEGWALRQEVERLRAGTHAGDESAGVAVDELTALLLGGGEGAACGSVPRAADVDVDAGTTTSGTTADTAGLPLRVESDTKSGTGSESLPAATTVPSPSYAAAAAGVAAAASSSLPVMGARGASKRQSSAVAALAGCMLVACATVIPGQGTGQVGAPLAALWSETRRGSVDAGRSAAARRLLGLDDASRFSLSSLWDAVHPDEPSGRAGTAGEADAAADALAAGLRLEDAPQGDETGAAVASGAARSPSGSVIRLPANTSWGDAELIERAEKQLTVAAQHAAGGRAEPILIEAALSSLPAFDHVDHLLCPKAATVPSAHRAAAPPGGAPIAPGAGSDVLAPAASHAAHLPAALSVDGTPRAPLSSALPTVMSILLPWDALARALPAVAAAVPAPGDDAAAHVNSFAQVSCIVTNVTHAIMPRAPTDGAVQARRRHGLSSRRSLPASAAHPSAPETAH